jgi:hypothetical protein
MSISPPCEARPHRLAESAQFLQMMRRLLVDRARARNMAKRSGRWAGVTLDEETAQGQAEVDVLDLDRALSALAAFDSRKVKSPSCAFSGGCRSKRPATCWASPSPRWSGSGRWPARGFTPVSPEPQHDA